VRDKPKSGLDGLKKGFGSAFTSIGSGLAGVVVKPVKGAKNNGVKGFFKGTGQGLAGLITKPVTGVVDVITKPIEGLTS